MGREDRKKQRKKQLRKRMLISGSVILVFVFIGCSILRMRIDNKNEQTDTVNNGDIISEEIVTEIPNEEQILLARESAKASGAPEEIVELLEKNPETLDFVAKYGELKDVPPAETIGELPADGSLPHLLQWDSRWGYQPYSNCVIAASGCGPTCLSMVITGLTGDTTVTPYVLAQYAEEMGYANLQDGGTYAAFMWETVEKWGLTSVESLESENFLRDEIANGKPVICNLNPGKYFTDVGHFIVITGYEDGVITVLDPFSIENTEKEWNYSDIKEQIAGLYSYELAE